MYLPERTRAVEPALVDVHDGAHEVLIRGTFGQDVAHHMIFDLEIDIVFPRRMVEAKGNLGELLAITRQEMKPSLDVTQEVIKWDVALEEEDRSDVRRAVARFRIQEGCILCGEPT